jgi:hypothetical protein
MRWEEFKAAVEKAGLVPGRPSASRWEIRGGATLVNIWARPQIRNRSPWQAKPFYLQAGSQIETPGTLHEAIALAGEPQEDVADDMEAPLDEHISEWWVALDRLAEGVDVLDRQCERKLRKMKTEIEGLRERVQAGRVQALEQAWQEGERFPESSPPAPRTLLEWGRAISPAVLQAVSGPRVYLLEKFRTTDPREWRATCADVSTGNGTPEELGRGPLQLVLEDCEAHEAAEREKAWNHALPKEQQ